MLDRSDTPWYPTMRLFRQASLGDWATPLGQVVDALQEETKAWAARDRSSQGRVSAAV
jgi:hypothetical protein